jgi:uracil-DNA glycosylase family 4
MPDTLPESKEAFEEPSRDCMFCPRLASFRRANRAAFPDWFNAPVPSFGSHEAELLIVGLAPGLKGANRTGRPFTGDYAGVLLYKTLLKFGLAEGRYAAAVDDGLILRRARITNAVRCVPPENKPLPSEIANCSRFLSRAIAAMPNLKAIVALGRIAFDAVLRYFGEKPSKYKFEHGGVVDLPGNIKLFASYHCSRYNTSTGRLTESMFHNLFEKVCAALGEEEQDQRHA